MARLAPRLGTGRMVTGLFDDRTSAECAYLLAVERGYDRQNVNVIVSDEARHRYFPTGAENDELASRAAEGPETPSGGSELGGPAGGTLATLAPAVVAVGAALLIPGIIFAGPVAIALTAAGTVGLASGLIGALAKWGIPQDRLAQYEDGVREGGILLGIEARSADDARFLEAQWKACGGRLVHS
jgi:hypothetical protein